MKTLVMAAAVLVFPLAAGAQQPVDPKWSPWLGCWELVLENARDSSARPSPSRRTLSQPVARPQICVEPSGEGVTFTTRGANQAAVFTETVVADGVARPITDADCRGTRRAESSTDGRRLYSRAELSCAADKGTRQVSGFSILGANGTWTDIQSVDISGQQTVRVRSYRRAGETTLTGRGLARASALTLDDVKEASAKVSPRALEAALVETGSSYDLSGKDLLALQAAGVPASVTDLIVALSYPDRFVVERDARADFGPMVPFADDPFFLGWSFGYPMWSDISGFYSPLYGPYSSYYYSPFAYSYLGWYDPRYFGGGSYVVVGDGGGGSGEPRPSGAGRVVDGLGYTRVRPRDAESRPPSSGSSPVSAGGGSSTASSSGGSGGGGGNVSSQGFSSGGSGGDGGRTAQPR